VIAEAEIAPVSRDLDWSSKSFSSARLVLERHGDRANATHARLLEACLFLLIGRLDDAEQLLQDLDPAPLASALLAAPQLVVAGLAMRRLRIKMTPTALIGAKSIASATRIPSLAAEVEGAARLLDGPWRASFRAARRDLPVEEIEALLSSPSIVVDACHRCINRRSTSLPLETRPVLRPCPRAR
jgi:hypothetical protein